MAPPRFAPILENDVSWRISLLTFAACALCAAVFYASRARPLHPTREGELADVAREIESRRSGVYRLSDEERAAVRAGMEAARRGDFVPEDEMDEFYRLHRGV